MFYPPAFNFALFLSRQVAGDAKNADDEGNSSEAEGRETSGFDFKLHRRRGQHLLTNPRVLDAIVRKAHVRSSDAVLEIGPGTGNLTLRLLSSARRVVAVEIDRRMVDALLARASLAGVRDRLTVMAEDALDASFPEFDTCVSNIPYAISSPLIAKLFLDTPASFRSATLLLQKEFARRLAAGPGDSEFNRLAANVGLVATVELLMDVNKRDFVPCPNVDSTLVCIRPRCNIPPVDLHEWLSFTRVCFGTKNKTLGAIFRKKRLISSLLGISSGENKEGEAIVKGKVAHGDYSDLDNQDFIASEIATLREKILGLLKAEGLEDKRPSKLTSQELLHLLQLLKGAGVFFH